MPEPHAAPPETAAQSRTIGMIAGRYGQPTCHLTRFGDLYVAADTHRRAWVVCPDGRAASAAYVPNYGALPVERRWSGAVD